MPPQAEKRDVRWKEVIVGTAVFLLSVFQVGCETHQNLTPTVDNAQEAIWLIRSRWPEFSGFPQQPFYYEYSGWGFVVANPMPPIEIAACARRDNVNGEDHVWYFRVTNQGEVSLLGEYKYSETLCLRIGQPLWDIPRDPQLDQLRQTQALGILRKAAADDLWWVRKVALKRLAEIASALGPDERSLALSIISKGLEDERTVVRTFACRALYKGAKLYTEADIAPLRSKLFALLTDRGFFVRTAAAIAIRAWPNPGEAERIGQALQYVIENFAPMHESFYPRGGDDVMELIWLLVDCRAKSQMNLLIGLLRSDLGGIDEESRHNIQVTAGHALIEIANDPSLPAPFAPQSEPVELTASREERVKHADFWQTWIRAHDKQKQ